MILPPSTLGVLGGGQLGHYFCLAAREMGYRTVVYDPDPDAPAAAHQHICAPYDDQKSLDQFAEACVTATVEFENIPVETLNYLQRKVPIQPSPITVGITQNRMLEKNFLADNGFPHVPFMPILQVEDLQLVPGVLFPAILKTQRSGYDGKGQKRVANGIEARDAWVEIGKVPCVLEKELVLSEEFSIVLARNRKNQIVSYPIVRNKHHQGILQYSLVTRTPPLSIKVMEEVAHAIARRLNYEGVMCVEFFLSRGKLWVNEIAPRPHNSGHFTLDACAVSQFQQQVRALCDLPLAPVTMYQDAAMVNLLGDLWQEGDIYWEHLLLQPNVHMHLYGKKTPKPMRKMGHFTVLSNELTEAWEIAKNVRRRLGPWAIE